MKCFFIRKQKIILFPKFRKNNWVTATSAVKQTLRLTCSPIKAHFTFEEIDQFHLSNQ
jgi:hypothetical protein